MKTNAPKFPLVKFAELKPGRSPVCLVKGLIPRVGLTVAWGPPKCGKSFWAYDVAMHVALGWQYRSRRVQNGAVIYCAFEGAEGFKARAAAFRLHHGVDVDVDVQFYLSPSQMDLVGDSAALVESIRQQSDFIPVLVVLDTLNRSLRGSESDDKDMSAYVRAADSIRDAFGCAVLIVHHCGIDATRPRGHTALAGAVDAQLAVKRDASDNIVVTVERMKDGPEGDTITSALEVVDVGVDDDGDTIASCVIVPSEGGHSVGARITGPSKIAFELLSRAIADEGKILPAGNHVPLGAHGVPVSLWRSYSYSGTVTDSDNPDSKRKAFNRAVKSLQAANRIGVWNDHVWIANAASGTA